MKDYALVPKVPTEDMLFAAEMSKPRGYRDLYEAMVAAAPKVDLDDAIKELYISTFGSDEGWLGSQGSYFIEGVKAALRVR